MDITEICFLTAAELSTLINHGDLSPLEVVDAHLRRIDELEPTLNSFITVLSQEARVTAGVLEEEAARGYYRGPLHGIPLGLKDVYDTKGIRTTFGCEYYADRVPKQDSTTVERLREAGAVSLGKLNLHTLEFGPLGENKYYGDMHNPWDITRHTGGSSGGSASAVASGECTVAMGTDSGGSIRVPASLCGIVGLKTTFGLLSRHGLMELSPNMDHHGPMARSVADCAMVLGAIVGKDDRDPWMARYQEQDYMGALTGDVEGVRIGLVKEFFELPVDSEVRDAVYKSMDVLDSLGAIVREVSWPMYLHATAASTAILLADTSASLQELAMEHGDKIDLSVRNKIESGMFIPVTKYIRAKQASAMINKESYDLLTEVDILAGPTVPTTAPKIDDDVVQVGDTKMPKAAAVLQYTRVYNLNGLPTISVPCGFSESGLPIGLQLAGRAFDEVTVLKVAHAYEQATSWHQRRPPL